MSKLNLKTRTSVERETHTDHPNWKHIELI